MGVSGLLPMFRGSTQTVHVSRYAHEVVAIDGYAWLHRGVHACASELGAGGASDKHIEFCMGRVALLLHYKVKPLLVFDGGALPAKAAQEASRRGKREHAKAMASQKAREDSHEEARKWYAKCVDVTPVMAKQLVDACAARWGDRVDFLVAPYEADAQLAQLARSGEAAAIVSEDSDNLAYGVPRVLFKLDADGSAQQVVLADLFAAGPGVNALDVRGWTQDMFVTMCALAGCDYVEAVKGVGIKNAHRLVARYKDRRKVLRALRYECAACPDCQALVLAELEEALVARDGANARGEQQQQHLVRGVARQGNSVGVEQPATARVVRLAHGVSLPTPQQASGRDLFAVEAHGVRHQHGRHVYEQARDLVHRVEDESV